MDVDDVVRILAKAAVFDSRRIGEADIAAWLEAVGDLDATDALASVTRHYRASADRLMPVHVRRLVDEIGRERARQAVAAARVGDRCEHGQPGGRDLHPATQMPLCPLCRRGVVAVATQREDKIDA